MALLVEQDSNPRSLADYLLGLRAELLRDRDARALTPEEFVAAITTAFSVRPGSVDTEAWRGEDLEVDEPRTPEDVDRILRAQILDLEEAHASGLDRDGDRYFGLDVSRRGTGERATSSYWFNWDPAGYLECGLAGTFEGWQPERPPRVIEEITWSDVAGFLWAGQSYE